MTEYKECPCGCGRHDGAYCERRAYLEIEEEYVDPFDMKPERVEKKPESGLDAPYYDFPDNIHSAMDLIEWLDLDFSQGNILKSIIRENNPNAKKKTSPIYEAEKQFYYAERRLRGLREKEAVSSLSGSDAEKGLRNKP